MERGSQGFTIVEVMMFLAVSGLLVIGAMIGVGANINNTRFNDGVRSTTSYLQRQYDEVSSGRNDRDNDIRCSSEAEVEDADADSEEQLPGMSECVVLGRYVFIQGKELKSRYIIGRDNDIAGIEGTDVQAINATNPVIAPATAYESTYQIPWSIAIEKGKLSNGATPMSLGIAIVRSPVSGNIVYFVFDANGDIDPSDLQDLFTPQRANKKTLICFEDQASSRGGTIRMEPGQGQEVIQADLSDEIEACV